VRQAGRAAAQGRRGGRRLWPILLQSSLWTSTALDSGCTDRPTAPAAHATRDRVNDRRLLGGDLTLLRLLHHLPANLLKALHVGGASTACTAAYWPA